MSEVSLQTWVDSHQTKSEGSLQTWVVKCTQEYQDLFQLVYDEKKEEGK